jgi:hypothetical protein
VRLGQRSSGLVYDSADETHVVIVSTRRWANWVKGRHLYFVLSDWRLVNTETSEVRNLPNPPRFGHLPSFVSFSPDGEVVLWQDSPGAASPAVVLHLTRITDGTTLSSFEADLRARTWLLDFTHEEDLYGPNA